jgi:hypothetical protein
MTQPNIDVIIDDGRYLLADSQMFTWRGSVDEYEDWKKTL